MSQNLWSAAVVFGSLRVYHYFANRISLGGLSLFCKQNQSGPPGSKKTSGNIGGESIVLVYTEQKMKHHIHCPLNYNSKATPAIICVFIALQKSGSHLH